MDLRYVVRDGERVLQVGFRYPEYGYATPEQGGEPVRVTLGMAQGWADVPVCDEVTGLPVLNYAAEG